MINLGYLFGGLVAVGGAIIVSLLFLELIIGLVFPKRETKSHLGD